MSKELIIARVKAFAFEAGSMFVTALVGVLISPDFSALITSHFGEGVVGSLIILVISGLAKNWYNMKQIKTLGAKGSRPTVLI